MRKLEGQFLECFEDVHKEYLKEGATMDIRDVAKQFTFNVTKTTLFGIPRGEKVEMDMDAMDQIMGILSSVGKVGTFYKLKYLRPKSMTEPVDRMRTVINNIVSSKLQDIKKKNATGEAYEANDILDMLLMHVMDSESSLSQNDLFGQLYTLAIAGTETTSNIIACLVYTLGQRSDIQDKIYNELVEANLPPNPTWEDLSKLTYTMQATLEALRYFSTAGVFGRDITEDIDVGDGKILKAGVRTVANILYIHFNEEYWPNAHEFNPDRFHEDNYTDTQKKAFFPFGWGSRLCIGHYMAKMEIVTFLYSLLSVYRVESAEEEIDMIDKFTRQPVNALNITLHNRTL